MYRRLPLMMTTGTSTRPALLFFFRDPALGVFAAVTLDEDLARAHETSGSVTAVSAFVFKGVFFAGDFLGTRATLVAPREGVSCGGPKPMGL